MKRKQAELKGIYFILMIGFAIFLIIPIVSLLLRSFQSTGGLFANYTSVFQSSSFIETLTNSFTVSTSSALITVLIAFLLAYTVHYTRIPKWMKKVISLMAIMPMLLPTITYGFAIIYSFGKQGLLTKLFQHQLFNIYGFQGLMLGYVIYTLPIAYVLIQNAMKYIDKNFTVVSKLMKDRPFKTFRVTLLRPLVGTLAAAFIQAFFLSFTDFGIPASVGGQYHVLSSLLYQFMLGSIPDFASGAVIAMMMLIPSAISIMLLHYLERYNIRYNKVSNIELSKNKIRDCLCGFGSSLVCISILMIFAVIVVVPFVSQWPYKMEFTFAHFHAVFQDEALLAVIKNTLILAIASAIVGTLVTYGAALVSARSHLRKWQKKSVDSIALITNTIPGMVIGIAYLFTFRGSTLQNTLVIMVICNLIHFFSTPYLMIKGTLEKMNASFETTAKLMGDSWFHTVTRVITPNAVASLLEVFAYFFVNATVTVSAIIFLAGARTQVITTKIKELQYFTKFNEIFILSILILVINLIAKGLIKLMIYKKHQRGEKHEKKQNRVIQ